MHPNRITVPLRLPLMNGPINTHKVILRHVQNIPGYKSIILLSNLFLLQVVTDGYFMVPLKRSIILAVIA